MLCVCLVGCVPQTWESEPQPEVQWTDFSEPKTSLIQLSSQQERIEAYNARFMMCSMQMEPDIEPYISRYLDDDEIALISDDPDITAIGFQLYKSFYNIQKATFTYEYVDGEIEEQIIYYDHLKQKTSDPENQKYEKYFFSQSGE